MKEVNPQQAYALMQGDKEIIYLDVRSVPEYEAGHPQGAINIPLLHLTAGGMLPNDKFPAVVAANLPKDAKILIGCKTGGRSANACQIMSQMGYTDVTNVRGGFVGASDMAGRMVEPGWSALNLPVATEAEDGADYESLAAKG
jgi:rhodanese-related sulfurtransferase